MIADAAGGLTVFVLFVGALAVPAISAYRGRYRSWTYRGWGTRYGAFAVGWFAAGLFTMVAGGIAWQSATVPGSGTPEWAGAVGRAIGAAGLLAMAAGMAFFAWMPPVLVPKWRREQLRNAKLYRDGDPDVGLRADILRMTGGAGVVVWHRNAPIIHSEWHALSVSAMHVRPRLRLPGRLRGPLPERTTGAVTDEPDDVEGELLVDADAAVFVQAPAEDAAHRDNRFVELGRAVNAADVADDGHGGSVMLLGNVPGNGALELFLPGDPAQVRRDLVRAMRPRRLRTMVDGRVRRVQGSPTP